MWPRSLISQTSRKPGLSFNVEFADTWSLQSGQGLLRVSSTVVATSVFVWGRPVCCGAFSSLPGLYPPDTRSTHPPVSPDIAQVP